MKTVIISGASGQLGEVVVRYFLEKDYQVVALVRENKGVLPPHKNLHIEPLDLLDEMAVETAVKKIIARYKTVNAALLLAGGFTFGNLEKSDMATVRRQISINFETAYMLSRLLFPHFIQNGYGRLVLVGSRPALDVDAGKNVLAYSLSKSLLFQLAELLNAEAKGKNVTATVIAPSTIDTAVNRREMPEADFTKWVRPEQIAELMMMICSDAGSPLRETVLKIYGEI